MKTGHDDAFILLRTLLSLFALCLCLLAAASLYGSLALALDRQESRLDVPRREAAELRLRLQSP